eukprot:1551722-Amphidinium_carterae.3
MAIPVRWSPFVQAHTATASSTSRGIGVRVSLGDSCDHWRWICQPGCRCPTTQGWKNCSPAKSTLPCDTGF